MNKSIKKQISFFVIILCGVGSYNYFATRPIQNTELNLKAQEGEREFMQKRAEYIQKNGDISPMEQRISTEFSLSKNPNLIEGTTSIIIDEANEHHKVK